mmetsp:Transcript_19926/g.53534  ORF Transcript_19926/g.53534 Transcript_19926/m.53534 type:complete len:213 (+) Transcript_19926:1663-2301(+)
MLWNQLSEGQRGGVVQDSIGKHDDPAPAWRQRLCTSSTLGASLPLLCCGTDSCTVCFGMLMGLVDTGALHPHTAQRTLSSPPSVLPVIHVSQALLRATFANIEASPLQGLHEEMSRPCRAVPGEDHGIFVCGIKIVANHLSSLRAKVCCLAGGGRGQRVRVTISGQDLVTDKVLHDGGAPARCSVVSINRAPCPKWCLNFFVCSDGCCSKRL